MSAEPTRPGQDHIPSRFRGDIDGLRAIAIVLIVAFHAGLPGTGGGFIGVDVFFVISGYLISRNLLAETSENGRVALVQFWSRRIRRLVPGLALMIVVVLVLAYLVLSPLEWQTVAADARLAALYVSNIGFASQASDYFADDVGSSLFLHTWSLGVEEQFYVVWPLLFAGVALFARGHRSVFAKVSNLAFVLVASASFTASLVLTRSGSSHAFYGLPTRAWEFAVAALVAAMRVPGWLKIRSYASAMAGIGLALIVTALVLFDSDVAYPGPWPLLPVVGTLLVIVAGSADPGGPISATLASAPARALGRVSYSWYLWHWPFIVLAIAAFESDGLAVTGGAAMAALLVGTLAYRFVENPLRFAPRIAGSPARTFAMGVTVTVAVLAATAGMGQRSDARLEEMAASSATDPSVTLADVRASKRDFTCQEVIDDPDGGQTCIDGDMTSGDVIMLIGDSHARHWKPVFARVASKRGLRLVIRWKSTCPAIEVVTIGLGGIGEDVDCQSFRRSTERLIDELDPMAVISATSDDYSVLVRGGSAAWSTGYRSFVETAIEQGRAVGTIVDTPRIPYDPLDCIASKGAEACVAPLDARDYGRSYRDAEQAVRDDVGVVAELDINPVLCDQSGCPLVIEGNYVYTDQDHLFEKFVLTQLAAVDAFVAELTGS